MRIRATVIGASQYTVQVSGNTIYLSHPELLPLRKGKEAISEYVGKYLESGLTLRRHSWKGCRRVEFDRRAKDDQNALVARYGGPEAVRTMGNTGTTPAPEKFHDQK